MRGNESCGFEIHLLAIDTLFSSKVNGALDARFHVFTERIIRGILIQIFWVLFLWCWDNIWPLSHDWLVDKRGLILDVHLVRLHRDFWCLLDHLELDRLLVEVLLIFELGLWHCWSINWICRTNCHSRKMLLLGVIHRRSNLLLMHKRILVHYDRVDLRNCLAKGLEVLRRVGRRLDLRHMELRPCIDRLELPRE